MGRRKPPVLPFDRLRASFGARYYDAAVGVWLTQDVYRGQIKQPLSLHRTLYVLANPVNHVDVYGYALSANGYGDCGGGSTAVDTGDSVPDDSSRWDNTPYDWKVDRDEERFESSGGGGGGKNRVAYNPGILTGPLHAGLSGPLISSPWEMPVVSISYTDPLYFDNPRIFNEGLPGSESYVLAAACGGQIMLDIPLGFAEAIYDTGAGLVNLGKGTYRLTLFNKILNPQDFEVAGEAYHAALGYMISHPLETGKTIGQGFVEPYREALASGRPGKAIGRGLFDLLMLKGTVTGVRGLLGKASSGTGRAVNIAEAATAGPFDELAETIVASPADEMAEVYAAISPEHVLVPYDPEFAAWQASHSGDVGIASYLLYNSGAEIVGAEYMLEALSGEYTNISGQIDCHGAALGQTERVGNTWMGEETGSLVADPRFKFETRFPIQELGENVGDLQPGDLLTYHSSSNIPHHSNRFMGVLESDPVFFDKPGPRFNYTLFTLEEMASEMTASSLNFQTVQLFRYSGSGTGPIP